MRLFLFFLLKIIITVYLTAFIIEFFSDRGLSQLKNSVYNDWKKILDGSLNSELVIMGSSRGFVSYDPQVLSKNLKLNTYNLSFNAAGFQLQLDKLDIYLKNNKQPKAIIQNIDIAHFNSNNDLPEENQFLPFVNNRDVDKLISMYNNKYKVFHYFPLLKYNQNLNLLKLGIQSNFYQKNIQNISTFNGFCPHSIPFKADHHNLKKLDEISINKSNFNLYKLKLEEILKFYKKKINSNTQVIFVWAPEHKLRLQEKYKSLYNSIINELINIDKQNANIYFY